MKCERDLSTKKKIKNVNSKMITNSQLSTTELKKETQKLTRQLEQEQNHRNRDHMEGYQWGRGGGKWGKRCRMGVGVQGRGE